LKYVSFENARLDNVDFSDAVLHGAYFKGARLKNVTMRGAVLTGVDLRYLDVPPEAISECVTDVTPRAAAKAATLKDKLDAHKEWVTSNGRRGAAAVLDGEDLRPLWEHFAGRRLTGLSAKNAVAIGVDFYGCALQGAKFDGADLRDADFSTADLSGASFVGAKLGHARFDRAHLGHLRLLSGEVLSPNLCDAEALPLQFRDTLMDDSPEALGLAVLSES
jgi:uncharacterized protein YjbI with pentapeptide repeats